MMDGEETPRRYSVRFSREAERNVTEIAWNFLQLTENAERAKELAEAIYRLAGTLTENPRRFAIAEAETARLKQETRRMLMRPFEGTTTLHSFYFVVDDSDDGPVVRIVHIRDARRSSLTPTEARRILGNQ